MIEPVPGYQFESEGARRGIVRSALFHTPLFLLAFGVLISVLLYGGGVVLLIIFGLVSLALGFQSISALRDIRSELVETTGQIRRKWSRSDFIFWRSHYLHVGNHVFSIERVPYEVLQPGDHVVIRYFPHTDRVQSIGRVREVAAPADPSDLIPAPPLQPRSQVDAIGPAPVPAHHYPLPDLDPGPRERPWTHHEAQSRQAVPDRQRAAELTAAAQRCDAIVRELLVDVGRAEGLGGSVLYNNESPERATWSLRNDMGSPQDQVRITLSSYDTASLQFSISAISLSPENVKKLDSLLTSRTGIRVGTTNRG